MLTIYLALLVVIPSNVAIAPLRSLGRPSLLWGLVLLTWWLLHRLRLPMSDVVPVRQPVRAASGLLLVVALVSLAAALLRGQPSDQVSTALAGMMRLFSWAGVVLVAMDGLHSFDDVVRLVRRLAIAGGGLGTLGLMQFIASASFVDFFVHFPGIAVTDGGVIPRGGFTRASGTAIHPLEYASALSALLPLAVATAVYRGFTHAVGIRRLAWWIPVGAIALSSYLAVSRSAIIGFAVAILATIPALPSRYRIAILGGCAAMAAAVIVMVPGLFGTLRGLFAGAGNDSSTLSRIIAFERAPEFIGTSPIFGNGFGTFLPRYYIFDNAWVLMTVELGVVGALALGAMTISAMWSAYRAGKVAIASVAFVLGRSLSAGVLVLAVSFLFFDGLSFPISGGLLFLLVGLCGGLRTISEARVRRQRDEDVLPASY